MADVQTASTTADEMFFAAQQASPHKFTGYDEPEHLEDVLKSEENALFHKRVSAALKEGDFELGSPLGQQFRRMVKSTDRQKEYDQAGDNSKHIMGKREAKRRWREQWCREIYNERIERRTRTRSKTEETGLVGQYEPFDCIVEREMAFVAARNYVPSCIDMGGNT